MCVKAVVTCAVITSAVASVAAVPVAGISDATDRFGLVSPLTGHGAEPPLAPADTAEALFQARCSSCHTEEPGYAPQRSDLGRRGPASVVAALTFGSMQPMAAGLGEEEIRAIASYLSGDRPDEPLLDRGGQASACGPERGPFTLEGPAWNGWGNDLANSRFQPDTVLDEGNVSRLRVKWAFALDGSIHSQPTVVGGRVFVSSVPGQLYALDVETGCVHWAYHTAPGLGGEWGGAGARSTVVVGELPEPGRNAAYLGDDMGHVHAVDVATGERIWRTRVDDHPLARLTGSPLLHEGTLYVPVSSLEESTGADPTYSCCTFRGSIVALDAASGAVRWRTYAIPNEPRPTGRSETGVQRYGPAGAPIWSAPTIDPARGVLYAATGNSYTGEPQTTANAILALDLESGRLLWSRQMREADNFVIGCPNAVNCPDDPGPDLDFGSSPVLRRLPGGQELLLVGDKGGMVYALDPDLEGEVVWTTQVGQGSSLGGIQWGSAADDQFLYVAVSDFLGPPDERRPGVSAVRITTGEVVWHTPAPQAFCSWPAEHPCRRGHSAAVSAIPGVVFTGSLDGWVRALSTRDGSILWAFDTARIYDTIGGGRAVGGSMDGAGPTIVDGTLFLTSGYPRWGHRPGNVLLAFTEGGR